MEKDMLITEGHTKWWLWMLMTALDLCASYHSVIHCRAAVGSGIAVACVCIFLHIEEYSVELRILQDLRAVWIECLIERFFVIFFFHNIKILGRKESVWKSTFSFQLEPTESSQRMSHTAGFPVRTRKTRFNSSVISWWLKKKYRKHS